MICELFKDMRVEDLAEAVRRAHLELRVIDPELAAEAWVEVASSHRS